MLENRTTAYLAIFLVATHKKGDNWCKNWILLQISHGEIYIVCFYLKETQFSNIDQNLELTICVIWWKNLKTSYLWKTTKLVMKTAWTTLSCFCYKGLSNLVHLYCKSMLTRFRLRTLLGSPVNQNQFWKNNLVFPADVLSKF